MSVITTVDKAVASFLDLIAFSEGTTAEPDTANDGYDVIVDSLDVYDGHLVRSVFTDYSDHPFNNGRAPVLVLGGDHPIHSTASGRYQIMLHTFLPYKKMLNLADFSPLSQDMIALELVKERKALPMIEAGNIAAAVAACSNIWASFPGNDYGQGGRSLQALLTEYNKLVSN